MSRWILFALIGMAFGVVMAAENCFSDFDPNITPDPQNRFRGFLTREGKEAGYILVLSRDLSYSTVKIKFEKEYLEVDTRDFFRQPEARQVTVGMVVKEDLQRLKATKIICSGTLSADNAAGSEVSLYFAGYKSGKHFWRRKVFPIPEKKRLFCFRRSVQRNSGTLRCILSSNRPEFTVFMTFPCINPNRSVRSRRPRMSISGKTICKMEEQNAFGMEFRQKTMRILLIRSWAWFSMFPGKSLTIR